MDNAQLINQDSGKTEYMTPPHIVDAARTVLGGIDLDPFSNPLANEKIVKADKYYTVLDDGLSLPWCGRVWMNHPFNRTMNPLCINKLINEITQKRITAACCITFSNTSESWFQPLLNQLQCFLYPRTQYLDKNLQPTRGSTKGSVVTYFGDNVELFAKIFSKFGTVK